MLCQIENLAGATGLEPAASCVAGRRSNQLDYAPLRKSIPHDYHVFLRLPIDSQNSPESAVTDYIWKVTN